MPQKKITVSDLDNEDEAYENDFDSSFNQSSNSQQFGSNESKSSSFGKSGGIQRSRIHSMKQPSTS